jgi:predicted GNAT superfamily acetyltransferase
MPDIQIQPLRSSQQFQACEDIQMKVWGKLVVSAELLKVTQEHGGVVLGAVAAGQVCGFVCAFLARYHKRLVHWSHAMAVRERFRDQGLGFQMKRLHRRLALEQGIKSICWTFDPLQSRNATLNISKLGAEIEEYVPDCYGHFPSIIEKGLPSDRFVVNWRIATRRVEKRLRAPSAPHPFLSLPRINETVTNADGFLENRRVIRSLSAPILLVEIPALADRMRQEAVELARRWRMETRGIFLHYFKVGYQVTDFIRGTGAESGRCFYVFSRQAAR